MNKLNQKKILLTGGSGFLGFHFLTRYPDLFIPLCSPISRTVFPHMLAVNLNKTEDIQALRKIPFDAIIHLAAMADTKVCEENPQISYRTNVQSTKELCEIAAKRKIPIVFTSTDLVFDGQLAPYSENHKPAPVNQYGKHKAEAEKEILSLYPEALICRLSLMYGYKQAKTGTYFNHLFQSLRSEKKVSLFKDEFRSVVAADDVVTFIIDQLETARGIVHLGGPDSLSRLEIGKVFCSVFNFRPELLQACSQNDFPSNAPRPANVSMDISLAKSMGFKPKTLEEGLQLVKSSY